MLTSVDTGTLVAVIVAGIVAHVLLMIGSRWVNTLFLIAAAFFLLSPASAAKGFALVMPAKYGRAYVTLLLPVVAILVLRVMHIGRTGFAFLLFAGLYTLGGLWSDLPLEAILFKGNYGLAVIAGLLMAHSIRNLDDLAIGMRALAVSSAVFALLIMIDLALNPAALSRIGRLAAWGMNGNRIGQTAAAMLVITSYVALYDPGRTWQICSYITCSFLGLIILYTGSRGAAGEAVIGCFIVGLPLIRRPGVAFLVTALVVLTAYGVVELTHPATEDRMLSTDFTRGSVWGPAWRLFQEAPVFGQGWVYTASESAAAATANLHSIYLQVLVEIGAFGLIVMLVVLGFVGLQCLKTLRLARSSGVETHTAYLAVGLVVSVFAHGTFESAPIMGSGVNVLTLALGLGLLDRLPQLYRDVESSWDEYDEDGSADLEADYDTIDAG